MNAIKCKCCDTLSPLLGYVDFFKSRDEDYYNDRNAVKPSPPQTDIPYFRCPHCGFIFTNAMDSWSIDDFRKYIYGVTNYMFVDNGNTRETVSYKMGLNIAQYFINSKSDLRVLDYGAGGNPGNLGQALIDEGFDVTSYEPYLSDNASSLKHSQYDLIISVEVFEHCNDLVQVGNQIKNLLARDGVLWIQTLLHPHPSDQNVLNSWYITPSNGHISIFTLPALTLFFRQYGINIVQTAYGLLGFKRLPLFANNIFI